MRAQDLDDITIIDLKMAYPELIGAIERDSYARGRKDGELLGRGLAEQGRAAAFLGKSRGLGYSPAGSAWQREGFLSEESYLAFNRANAAGQIHIFSKSKEGRGL